MRRLFFAVLSLGVGLFVLAMNSTSMKATLNPTGLAKPLANLRDYNGTYTGTLGTGSIDFIGSSGPGTLYRDNEDYGALSGCIGEGCGKHPGVDIPITSNTPVYSSSYGTVIYAACNGGWGGRVTVQTTNPWSPYDTIYYTYAHLRSISVSVGTGVWPGYEVGRSGGASSDPCPGTSTGAHLHFQIDKHHPGVATPYFPSTAYERDTKEVAPNFPVTQYTYNPLVFVQGGYRWGFNAGYAGTHPMEHRELWSLINIDPTGNWGSDGWSLRMDNRFDSHIRRGDEDESCGMGGSGWVKPCSKRITVEASQYQTVYLDINNYCNSSPGKVYFTTQSSPGWSESKSVQYNINWGTNQVHLYMPAMNPSWIGIITGLRVDPGDNCMLGFNDSTYYNEITIER